MSVFEDIIATTLRFHGARLGEEQERCIACMLANNVRANKPKGPDEAIDFIRWEINGIWNGLPRWPN